MDFENAYETENLVNIKVVGVGGGGTTQLTA
jgi:cell division GTPase FtsZ